jgi:hypothetical protein
MKKMEVPVELRFSVYRGPGFMMLGDSAFAKRYRQRRPDIWERVKKKLKIKEI